MPDKKLTDKLSNNSPILSNNLSDNKIIKALETHKEYMICAVVDNKKTHFITNEDVLDLINRLQAEVKKANRTVAGLMYENDELKRLVRPMESEKRSIAEFSFKKGKAEAYKEFAELVHCHCESIINHEWNKKVAPVSWADAYEQFDDEVDNLSK